MSWLVSYAAVFSGKASDKKKEHSSLPGRKSRLKGYIYIQYVLQGDKKWLKWFDIPKSGFHHQKKWFHHQKKGESPKKMKT